MKDHFTILNVNWYFDSGWSKHMIGDQSIFSSFTPKKVGFISYSDNK